MRINFLYIAVLIIGSLSCAPNDIDGPNPNDLFVKFYGLGTNEAVDIVRTSTGEIIVLAKNTNGNNSDFYLLKTDEGGNELASRIIDLNNDSEDTPTRLKPVDNDEFLIVGYMTFRDVDTQVDQNTSVWGRINSDLEVISTDDSGNPGFNFIDSLIATDIIQTSDANPTYVVLGHSTAGSRRYAGDLTPAGESQIYMGKYDDNDSVYWEKSHGFTGNENALSIFEVDNGGFLVIGSTRATAEGYGGTNLYILQTNKFGTADEGALVTGIPGADIDADDIPYSVKKSSLGYSIVGSTSDEATGADRGFHLAVSSSGLLVNNSSSVLSNDFGLACEAYTFARTLSNELMVLGQIGRFVITDGDGTTVINKNAEIMVMKVSPITGHIDGFDQNYGTSVGDDKPVAALTLPDGDILVASTIDFGSGTTMVGLLRLNANGELKD
ncbi:MAG: hypothetical protein CMP48_16030 [Rickettsiales bacterium]|nr:hypothetical protein [Rickettsiales bacterium]